MAVKEQKRDKAEEKKFRRAKKAEKTAPKMYSATDPGGSYTGVPADKRGRPVQDADDL